jgi:hypothetical protein
MIPGPDRQHFLSGVFETTYQVKIKKCSVDSRSAFQFQDKIFNTVKKHITYLYETDCIELYAILSSMKNPDENADVRNLARITYSTTGI